MRRMSGASGDRDTLGRCAVSTPWKNTGLFRKFLCSCNGFRVAFLTEKAIFHECLTSLGLLVAGILLDRGPRVLIPALLVSVAAGIVVTKGSTEGTADEVMLGQLGAGPKPLAIAGGAAAVMALLPGMPMLPFLALAGLAAGGAWAAHLDDITGTLKPGLAADLVLIDGDLESLPPLGLGAAGIALTVSGGRITYEAPGFA